MKFRATVVDRVTLLNVEVLAEAPSGNRAMGFGSMPLGNVWSFPSAVMTFDETLDAMKRLALDIAKLTESYPGAGHPIELNHELEPLYFSAADALGVREPIPKLCTLVVASAFDAAVHDAYGKAVGKDCYQTYGPADMPHDLSRYLDQSFRGEFLDRYVSEKPAEWLYVYHLVGALDPLTMADVQLPLNDGLPETLEEWVRREGLSHLKIKLDGNDLDWDVDRVLSVDRVASACAPQTDWQYSLDFNERCPNAEYVLEAFDRISEASPQAFARIQYVEQPTHRDLSRPNSPTMHAVAGRKPVVIDESLVDYDSLLRARELGYTGVALKACKGQSNALLMTAAARKFGMFLCVQDLTCPGASLLQSAGLAAHVPTISAIESNGRQYVPAANAPWESRFPGIFNVDNGRMRTGTLGGLGLGIVPDTVRSIHA